MALAEQELAMTEGGEQFLRRFLSLLSGRGKEYDYILLDAPPSLGPVKAASGYDSSRKVPFPVFGTAVMRNTVRMEFRKAEKDRR